MNNQPLTSNERLELISRPYLTPREVCLVIGRSKPTINKKLKEFGIFKTELGYLTDDIIKVFQLGGAIKRWKTGI